MICSPTEPAQLRDAADAVSMFPESFGADLVVPIHGGGWAGIQRKEIADLCASIEDNRLSEQLVKLRQLTMSMLIVEGELEWTNDGEMLSRRRWKSMTRDRFDGVMWHVQADGTWVCFTRDLAETIRVAKHFEKWTAKPRKAMATRPPVTAAWGTPDSRDFQVHLLTGFPGVGPELAERIIDHFGGVPWTWKITVEELQQVAGIGKRKAEQIMGLVPA